MPIKPENLSRYPTDWPEIRERILTRAGQVRHDNGVILREAQCEKCGVLNHQDIIWTEDGWTHIWSSDAEPDYVHIVLTIAHFDHTPENCADENLRAWCQRCHNRYDVGHRKQTRRLGRDRGQLELAPESVEKTLSNITGGKRCY